MRRYLRTLPPGSDIAVEVTGSWYWLVEEIEQAGHHPRLANAGEAKKRMGRTHKTDRLDAKGLAILLRNGSLPEVWIPPAQLRDQRELLRTRISLRVQRTQLKNRIHAALTRYGVRAEGISDLFGTQGRQFLELAQECLPVQTAYAIQQQLQALDALALVQQELEQRIHELVEPTPAVQLLLTLPGVGPVLGPLIALESGDVKRFPSASHLASYAGLVPRVYSSGGRTVLGRTAPNVNRYLKWAYVEAANVIVMQQQKMAWRHVVRLYRRLQPDKGHGVAVVAIARHLAQATYGVLSRQEPYREPRLPKVSKPTPNGVAASSAPGSARSPHSPRG